MLAPKRQVLLTGAGFTSDFGGYLASQMWSVIFSQPEVGRHPDLQQHMREQLDFEAAYSEVIDSDQFSQAMKNDFTTAVERAYQQIHNGFYSGQEIINKSIGACRSLIGPFSAGSADERGFAFTLNQDLFMERFFVNGSLSLYEMSVPGISNYGYFNWNKLPQSLPEEYRIALPNEQNVEKLASKFWTKTYGRFSYMKLHGSYWWRTTNGSNAMVIGNKKTGLIDREPYLKWSHAVFGQVLKGPGCELVVIGYGFGDEHINRVIADSIQHHGLKLHVVSPEDRRAFKNKLMPIHGAIEKYPPTDGSILWNGLCGYYQGRVVDLYTYTGGNSNLTPLGESLVRNVGL